MIFLLANVPSLIGKESDSADGRLPATGQTQGQWRRQLCRNCLLLLPLLVPPGK